MSSIDSRGVSKIKNVPILLCGRKVIALWGSQIQPLKHKKPLENIFLNSVLYPSKLWRSGTTYLHNVHTTPHQNGEGFFVVK